MPVDVQKDIDVITRTYVNVPGETVSGVDEINTHHDADRHSMTLMADPADDTAARGHDAETDFVPDAARTQAAELAWSDADDEPDRQPWRAVALRAAAVLAATGLVAGGMLLYQHGRGRTTSTATPSTVTVSVTPSPSAAAPPPAPAPPPSTVTVTPPPTWAPPIDDQFLADLNRAGMHILSSQKTISEGHNICWDLGQGSSRAQIESALLSNVPSFTPANAKALVGASIRYYCPEYGQ